MLFMRCHYTFYLKELEILLTLNPALMWGLVLFWSGNVHSSYSLGVFAPVDSSSAAGYTGQAVIHRGNADALKQTFIQGFKAVASRHRKIHLTGESRAEMLSDVQICRRTILSLFQHRSGEERQQQAVGC